MYKDKIKWGTIDGIQYLWSSVPFFTWKFMQAIKEGEYYYQYVPDRPPRKPFRFILGPVHESKINFEDEKIHT